MKLVKTVPLALFILSTGVGCSSTPTPPTGTGGAGTGGTPGTGGTATGGTSTGGTSTGGTSTGGVGTGGTSTGGTGTGGAGTGGAPDPLDPANILPGLDGTFWAFRAQNVEHPDGKYWLTAETTCDAAGTTLTKEFTAAGTPGQPYTVHFQFRGALALRCYEGGTTTATAPDAAGVKNESFYAGGQLSGDGPTLGITVEPAAEDAAAGTYFLNGIPSDSGACDQTITYDVGYEAEFVVLGGSTVTLEFHSPDCQALENCGPDAGAACAGRSIDMADFEIHASPSQPVSDVLIDGEDTVEIYPQWMGFDITEVTTTP